MLATIPQARFREARIAKIAIPQFSTESADITNATRKSVLQLSLARIIAPVQTKPPPINPHRLARLIVLARAMIVWAAAVLFENIVPSHRRIRQRYGMLAIGKLTRLVRNLLIARASQLASGRSRMRRPRNHAPTGFHRRMRARNPLRSIGGARLRRFMNAGGDAARFARLLQIIGDLDAYARDFLLRRAENGVNRLLPLLLSRPMQDAPRSLAAPTPALANTS